MGLLKDVYDIIVQSPDAKKLLGDELVKFIKGPGIFGKAPTIQEQLNKQKLFIEKLKASEFPNSFTSRLDYLGILLAVIAQTTHLKKRGCFIEHLYSDKFNFYFPYPASEPQMMMERQPEGTVCYLRVDDPAHKAYIQIYSK